MSNIICFPIERIKRTAPEEDEWYSDDTLRKNLEDEILYLTKYQAEVSLTQLLNRYDAHMSAKIIVSLGRLVRQGRLLNYGNIYFLPEDYPEGVA